MSPDGYLREIAELNDRLTDARRQCDGAYLERNRLVALLASVFPARRTKTAIEGWAPEWHNCVFIELPTGQVSWHFHDREAELFAHVREEPATWDGHTTEEKYERVAKLARECGNPIYEWPT